MFADAYAATVAYAEFPYAVRRRRASVPEDERIRIATELQSVQERIAHHSAWLYTESKEVGQAYEELVNATRRIAGGAIRQAWELEPITTDAGMNIGIEEIDLRAWQLYPYWRNSDMMSARNGADDASYYAKRTQAIQVLGVAILAHGVHARVPG